MKKFLAFLLLVSLCLSGCIDYSSPAQPSDNTSELTSEFTSELTSELPDVTEPLGIELSGYTVIRAENASINAVSAATYLTSELKKLCGNASNISIKSDWLEKTLDPASDEIKARHEILIGVTNRPESVSNKELKENEWSVTVNGNKIVIFAGSDFVLLDACKNFVKAIKSLDGDHRLCMENDRLDGAAKIDDYEYILAADQKNSQISVYALIDNDISPAAIKKSFKLEQYNVADARLRNYNGKTVLMAAYGTTCAKMLDYETGEVLWATANAANNPHACELIPGGIIGVASSTGAELRFFDAKGDGSEVVSIPYGDAHGLLWDPDFSVVRAIGQNELRSFEVKLENGKITVTEREELKATIPTTNAHDLQPVSGDHDRFWVTTSSAVYQYSKKDNKFYTDYEGNALINIKDVKSIGNLNDKKIILTTPDKAFKSWTTGAVTIIATESNNKSQIKSNLVGFYKVRPANESYQ